ncbi:MAG: hypothetical protein ACXVZP_06795 [Gaiellaceae bacterium]
MSSVVAPASAGEKGRLTAEELRELRNTFEMRGLMPKEQARLLAHVEALEAELWLLRRLPISAGRS